MQTIRDPLPDESQIQTYTYSERIYVLNQLLYVSIAALIVTILSTLPAINDFFSKYQLPYLLLFIIDLLTIFTTCLAIYWSSQYRRQLANILPDNYEIRIEVLQNCQKLAQFHTLFCQLTLAGQVAITYILILLSENFLPYIQIVILSLIIVMTYFGYIHTHNTNGTKRIIVFTCTILGLLILSLSAVFLKKCLLEILFNVYQVTNLDNLNVALIIYAFMILLVFSVNFRKIKNLFAPVGFLSFVILIITTLATGQLTREVQIQQLSLGNTTDCMNVMNVIGEDSLKQMGCREKYLFVDYSPYLPCEQSERAYVWEPLKEQGQLGCLNRECCTLVAQNVLYYPQAVSFLMVLLVSLGFVQTSNVLLLSRKTIRVFKLRTYCDIVMILLFCLAVTFGVTYVYISVPHSSFQLQKKIVQYNQLFEGNNQVIMLKERSYDNFKLMSSIEQPSDQNCQPFSAMNSEKLLKVNSLRIAIEGTEGYFKYNVNDPKIYIMMNDDVVKMLFGEIKPSNDYLIFQGEYKPIEDFYNNNIQFCSENPIDVQFRILQEPIDLNQIQNQRQRHSFELQKQLSASGNKRVLQAGSQTNEKVNNQMLDSLQYYQITKLFMMLQNTYFYIFKKNVKLFLGVYLYSSCQAIANNKPILEGSTENGTIKFNNLNFGFAYTAVVAKHSLKLGCIQIDLTTQAKIQLNYTLPLTPQIPQYSMRLVLQWYGEAVDLDLFGLFQFENHDCLAGSYDSSCGGMEYKKQSNNLEYLTINKIEPFKYLFYVVRNLNYDDVLKKLLNNKELINSDIILAKPRITMYVHEIVYPVIEYSMPICNQSHEIILIIKLLRSSSIISNSYGLHFALMGLLAILLLRCRAIGQVGRRIKKFSLIKPNNHEFFLP